MGIKTHRADPYQKADRKHVNWAICKLMDISIAKHSGYKDEWVIPEQCTHMRWIFLTFNENLLLHFTFFGDDLLNCKQKYNQICSKNSQL